MVVWKGRELLAAGEMTRDEFIEYAATGYVASISVKCPF